MPSIDSVFPSHYLKASDLNNASPTVTIDRLEIEPIGRDREMKPVLYFQGKEKGLVLNKTNASKIAQLLGSKDTDDWSGSKIKLYATEAEFGGETFEAIRIKAAGTDKPAPKPAEPAFVPEGDVPF
jgi:hypothetical protein